MAQSSTHTQSDLIFTIVGEVAAAKDVDPLALPPLNDEIDTDALTEIFRHTDSGTVEFRYADCPVSLRANGGVEVVAGRAHDSE